MLKLIYKAILKQIIDGLALVLLYLLERKRQPVKFEPRTHSANNKVGMTSYPYKDKAIKIKGGDAIVEDYLREILEKEGFEVENIIYDSNKIKFGKFLEKILGVAYVYSKIINKEGRKYNFIICGSEVLYEINHPKCINIFHISYYGYYKNVIQKTSGYKFLTYRKLWSIQRFGAKNTYNIAVSEYLKSYLEASGIHVNKVIKNCIDTNLFRPLEQIEVKKDFVFVGTYSWYAKGFDILEKLAKKGLEIDCYTNRSHDQKGNLNFLGFMPNAMMPEIYNKYKMLIFPSRYESCQLVPIEAMACGLPVMISNVGIGLELRKEIPEFVVESEANDIIYEYLEKINHIRNNYDHYSKRAREYVLNNHSFNMFKSQWIGTFKEINSKSAD